MLKDRFKYTGRRNLSWRPARMDFGWIILLQTLELEFNKSLIFQLLGNSPMKRLWSTASEISRSFGQVLASLTLCLMLLQRRAQTSVPVVLWEQGLSMDQMWLHFGGSFGKFKHILLECHRVKILQVSNILIILVFHRVLLLSSL